jgi:type I restriction enzyme M protein
MALLNMLLNSLTGEIAHMNSLSNDFYTGYKVATVLADTEFTEPSQSPIWLHDLKGTDFKSKFGKPFEPPKQHSQLMVCRAAYFR